MSTSGFGGVKKAFKRGGDIRQTRAQKNLLNKSTALSSMVSEHRDNLQSYKRANPDAFAAAMAARAPPPLNLVLPQAQFMSVDPVAAPSSEFFNFPDSNRYYNAGADSKFYGGSFKASKKRDRRVNPFPAGYKRQVMKSGKATLMGVVAPAKTATRTKAAGKAFKKYKKGSYQPEFMRAITAVHRAQRGTGKTLVKYSRFDASSPVKGVGGISQAGYSPFLRKGHWVAPHYRNMSESDIQQFNRQPLVHAQQVKGKPKGYHPRPSSLARGFSARSEAIRKPY